MEPEQSLGVTNWLNDLTQRHQLTKKSLAVLRALAAYPRLSSYGSIRDVAEKASVSIGTVTRAAQSVDFAGWPALQMELRTRYIASLSALEISAQRRSDQGGSAFAYLSRDLENLNTFIKNADLAQLKRVAEAIAKQRRTFIVAVGSYNGIGHILAHSASLHGYDVRLLSEEAQIINWVSQLGPDDLLITLSFWRLYKTSFDVINLCHENGVPVVLIAENVTREIEDRCLETVHVPSEAIGFSPSMTTVASVSHAIVAELDALDPARSQRALEQAESSWNTFGLLHKY